MSNEGTVLAGGQEQPATRPGQPERREESGRSEARRGAPGGERAAVGIALGTVAVIVSATLLFLLRHLLVRVVHEISLGA